MSKFVEIQSRLTFSCKSWKNVSQIIDFADIFPGFLCFLHFWGITHPSKFHFMEIRWQNFKNKQILSAPDHQLLLTPTTYHALQRTKRKRKSKRKTGHSYNLSGVFLRSERDCRYIWHRHETFNPYEGVSKFTSVFPNSSIVMLRTLRMAS